MNIERSHALLWGFAFTILRLRTLRSILYFLLHYYYFIRYFQNYSKIYLNSIKNDKKIFA